MPDVKGKKFAYTPKGMDDARAYAAKLALAKAKKK